MRQGKTFYFGDESTRALPGDTFTLTARLDHGAIVLEKDGARLTLTHGTDTIDALPMPTLAPTAAHARRVVGLATSTTYHGEPLGKLGPVTFAKSDACTAAGATRPFHADTGWHETRGSTLYGSVRFPASLTRDAYDAQNDVETITLFP
jgi:hypothetical protein